VFVGDLNVDVLRLEALDISVDLPSLLILVDFESGMKSALTLQLSLAVGFALCLEVCLVLCFPVDLAQQLIDLAEEVVEW
jgi:hypothetical protein